MIASAIIKRSLLIFIPLAALLAIVSGTLYTAKVSADKSVLNSSEFHSVEHQKELVESIVRSVVSDVMVLSAHQELHLLIETGDESYRQGLAREYLSFSNYKQVYDQIRFLDHKGMEVIRINYNSGKPDIAPDSQLQSKGDRYYFRDVFELERREVFISPLDLNIEHGEIEQPLKPMIRIGTPVFDSAGKKRGIVLVNYLARDLIDDFEQVHELSIGKLMLLNYEGYWLKGLRPEDEWGFMYEGRKDRTFGNRFPEAQKRIFGAESGQFVTPGGMFTFSTIRPVIEGLISSTGSGEAFAPSARLLEGKDYYWKIVSYVSPEVLVAGQSQYLNRLLYANAVLILLLAAGSWLVSKAQVIRNQSEEKLRAAEIRFHQLIDEASDGMFVVDADTADILDVNKRVCSSTGYSRGELLNMRVTDIEAVLPDQYSWDNHVKAVKNAGFMVIDGEHRRKDGSTFPVEVNVKYVILEDKDCMIAIVRDITERKRAEEALKIKNEELEKALSEVKSLRGLIPICANCKNIRDEKGYWSKVEKYIEDHTEAEFTHSICEVCAKKLYPDLYE